MSQTNILAAGFGGQGILFSGKVLSYIGLIDNKEVSWLPSYGPEMRGGTANCSVCIADEPIASPLVLKPDILIVMNLPSYDKFISSVAPGGSVFIDSSLVSKKCERTDITAYYVPASSLAVSEDLSGLANMILLGKVLGVTGLASDETMRKVVEACVPPRKKELIEPNLRALALGKSA